MRLKRLADEIQGQVSQDLLLTVDGSEPFSDFELDFQRDLDLDGVDEAMRPFIGRDLSASDDGDMAVALHGALALVPREAADRNVWWWLALRRYPDIVRRRWMRINETAFLSLERMLGQVNRNAFARLWWGAEMVRSTSDPDLYTRRMFANQDLFEAVIGRSLSRFPTALQVILDELSGLQGKDAREIVRDVRFLLSTLVLEAMSADAIRQELLQLKARRAKVH